MKKTRKKGGSLNRKNNASNCKHYHLSLIRPEDHYEFCDQDADYIDYPGGDKLYAPSDINGKIIERDWLETRFHEWKSLKQKQEKWEKYNNPDPPENPQHDKYSAYDPKSKDYLYPDITTLEQFNVLRNLHKIPQYILDKLPDEPTFKDIEPFLPKLNRINAFKRTRKLPDYRWKDLWDKSRDERQGKYMDSTRKPIKYNFWDLYDPENPPKPFKKWW